jgi:hypothetical protein
MNYDRSPYRLLYIGDGMGTITRVDDHNYHESVSGGRDACYAVIRQRHHEWHREQRIASITCPLERFIAANCKSARGHRITLAELYEQFLASLPSYDREQWGKHTIRKRLPPRFPCGPATGNVLSIGNLSFDPAAKHKPQRYRLVDDRLKLVERRR